ncbi:P-loop containing nucleoside triphosphate hydrolase protein [Xylariomycetidae sp. FL2044]|nr:P-loop containing nucleoside triphosphate hydrolase protein [Xylariomycetidae sp. FL2044]
MPQRYIDTLPTPAHVKPKKLIVLSAPRTGTHGLYKALKQIGFTPYHFAEALGNTSRIKIMLEGMNADLHHEGQPYGREEFDKWLADYDVIVEGPFFMPKSFLRAYPDAKFLLVERDPEKWMRSYVNTIGQAKPDAFPLSLYRRFDEFLWLFSAFVGRLSGYLTYGAGTGTERGRRNMVRVYEEYIAEVKRTVPPAQLKVCRLEDGFGWNEVCPYIGVPVPDMPWPSINRPDEFHTIAAPTFERAVKKTAMACISVLVPVLGVGLFYFRKGRLPMSA